MHVALVSYYYDRDLADPVKALLRYDTAVGLAEGLSQAGARVTVVQRFPEDAVLNRHEATYRFVRDPTVRMGSLVDSASLVNRAVVDSRPDVVHVHGLSFARQCARLRRVLPASALVLQDHANRLPRNAVNRATLGRAMRDIDGVFVTAMEIARPWRDAAVLPTRVPVFEVVEGSSRFNPGCREAARARTALTGDPLVLWVGRLNENKDPMTVLAAFAAVSTEVPAARMAMAFGTTELLPDVRRFLDDRPAVADRVTLLGAVEHSLMEDVYRSADLFVLGSTQEGSGYALLEALSCGVTPVVTDIPAFRSIAGSVGWLWPPGNADACGRAIIRAYGSACRDRVAVRRHFDDRLSFLAIGRTACEAYRSILAARGSFTS